jgi:diketogulonate reductase-like aldo/keto reductase
LNPKPYTFNPALYALHYKPSTLYTLSSTLPQERALWAGIADSYDQGLIKAVGLSNYGPKQLRKIHRCQSAQNSSSNHDREVVV